MLTSFFYKDGVPIQIASLKLTENDIAKIRKQKLKFRCPVCGEETIFKSGLKKIAHFAHLAKSDCPDLGETELHIKTKLAIYDSLVATLGKECVFLEKIFRPGQGNDSLFANYKESIVGMYVNYFNLDGSEFAKTEFYKYVSRGFAIPDIYFEHNGQKVAIEIQKTKIDEQEFYARTLFYNTFGISVLWVVPEEEIYDGAERDEDNYHCVYRNMPNLWKQIRKYSFGKIYTYSNQTGLFKMWKVSNVSGCRSGFENQAEGIFYNGGPFTYKKLKHFQPVFRTKDLATNFSTIFVSEDEHFRKPIGALMWMPEKKPN